MVGNAVMRSSSNITVISNSDSFYDNDRTGALPGRSNSLFDVTSDPITSESQSFAVRPVERAISPPMMPTPPKTYTEGKGITSKQVQPPDAVVDHQHIDNTLDAYPDDDDVQANSNVCTYFISDQLHGFYENPVSVFVSAVV